MPPLSAGRTSRWTLPHEGVDEQAHPEGEGDGPRQVETATVSGRLAASSCGRRPGRHRRHTDVDRVERPQPLHPLAYSPDDQIDVGIVQDDQARLAGVGSGPTGTTQPWRATRCGSRSWWRCPEAGGTSTSGTRKRRHRVRPPGGRRGRVLGRLRLHPRHVRRHPKILLRCCDDGWSPPRHGGATSS